MLKLRTILACTVLTSAILPIVSNANGQIFEVISTAQQSTIKIGGTVLPYQEVTLAAQLPGRVTKILGREGDIFAKDQVLLQLDDTNLLAQRNEAMAALNSAQAAANNARIQYSREYYDPQSERAAGMPGMAVPGMFDQVFGKSMASAMDMDNPNVQRRADLSSQGSRLTQAQSSVAQAEAKISQIDSMIRDSRSIAPFAGTISKKLVEIGDTVQPGQPMLVFSDLSQLQVKANVPIRLGHKLKAGQSMMAKLDIGDQLVPVKVAQVFPVADHKRHTITVKFDLPAGVSATPGMYADVLLPDSSQTASTGSLMIPRSALLWRGSMPGVKVVNDDGQASLKLLRIKYGSSGDMVEVYAGLKQGDRILVPNP